MTTMEQAVDQSQQELVTVRAQIASRVHMSEAVHAADNLTTVHAQEDPPSTIDVNSRDRLKEFSGRGEDFQLWARTTEAFFAGVIMVSEMTMEITMTPIDLEFSPTDSNVDRGVQNLEFVVQQMHTALMALTSFEANDIVANSRKQKNPLEAWRRLHERQNRAEMSSEKESERLQKESWREKPRGKYARTESLRESESER